MKRTLIALVAFLVATSFYVGRSCSEDEEEVESVTTPPEAMVKKLTDVIRQHCPDAKFEVTKEAFIAKHDTLMFTLHGRGKDGVAGKRSYRREGPNYTGFILEVALRDHGYSGAYAGPIPATFKEPYFIRYFDTPDAEDGKKSYWINCYYGSSLDPKLKRALFDVIPKTRPPEVNEVPLITAPPEEWVKKMTEAIHQHCPEAKIEVTKTAFIAKHETMIFTIHPRAADGEISLDAREIEGPNKGGFLLEVSLVHDWPGWIGVMEMPKTVKEPYFERFVDRSGVKGEAKHYRIDFAYNHALKTKLKQAILDSVPSSQRLKTD